MHARAAVDGDGLADRAATGVGEAAAGVELTVADATGEPAADAPDDAEVAGSAEPVAVGLAGADALGDGRAAAAEPGRGFDGAAEPSPQAASTPMATRSIARRMTTKRIGDPPLTCRDARRLQDALTGPSSGRHLDHPTRDTR
jgi:hypothetical protein